MGRATIRKPAAEWAPAHRAGADGAAGHVQGCEGGPCEDASGRPVPPFPRSPRGKVSGWDGQKKLRALGPAPSLSTCGAGPGAGIGGVRREAVWRRLRAHLFAKKGIFEKI